MLRAGIEQTLHIMVNRSNNSILSQAAVSYFTNYFRVARCRSYDSVSMAAVASRCIIATVLFASAIAKETSREPGVVDVTVSILEAVISFLFIVGRCHNTATFSASIFLCGSVCWSIINLTFNIQSCGCFGLYHVNARHIVMFSSSGLGALLLVSLARRVIRRSYFTLVQGGLVISNGLLFGAAFLMASDIVSGVDNSVGSSVPPYQEWIGKPMPLKCLNGIDEQFRTGKWTIVFLRTGCSHCDQVASKWQQSGTSARHLPTARKLAFVYLNDSGPDASTVVGPWVCGHVVGDNLASLATPSTVWLTDNQVERVETP